ncbi:AIR synthase related protein (plasmid) [Klebsiella quasipneumoniae]|uniref:AIR synthase related protein n=1 Tax=Klebsiella quasipneumoniae TaxID=1463165 RepID=UPI00351EE2EB
MNPSLPALIARLHAFSGIAHKRDIQQVARELRDAWPNPCPNGDDCALIPDGSGYKLLAIEGFINRFVAEDLWFAGWCGVMVNLSDIAAMGGRPLAVVNALWDEAQPHAAQILQGMAAASRAYQVPIVGGHTNLRSDRSQLAVAVLGETASPLSSSAAQAGQTLMVAINLQGGGTRREITGTRRPARIPPNCAGLSRCCRSWPPRGASALRRISARRGWPGR